MVKVRVRMRTKRVGMRMRIGAKMRISMRTRVRMRVRVRMGRRMRKMFRNLTRTTRTIPHSRCAPAR